MWSQCKQLQNSLFIFAAGVSKVGLERRINTEIVVHYCCSSSMSLSSCLLWATLKNKPWISRDRISLPCNMLTYSLPNRRSSRVSGAGTLNISKHFTLDCLTDTKLSWPVYSWCTFWSLSVWVDEWQSSTLSKTRKSRLNVFWLLGVGLHGLGVHFCLGLHNVGKKKL